MRSTFRRSLMVLDVMVMFFEWKTMKFLSSVTRKMSFSMPFTHPVVRLGVSSMSYRMGTMNSGNRMSSQGKASPFVATRGGSFGFGMVTVMWSMGQISASGERVALKSAFSGNKLSSRLNGRKKAMTSEVQKMAKRTRTTMAMACAFVQVAMWRPPRSYSSRFAVL